MPSSNSTRNIWQKLAKPILALAPMEDVTDTVFRRLVASCGRPHVFFTEFTSTDGLFSKGRENVIHRLQFTDQERPLIAQIWGNNPENYYKAAKLLDEMGFDGIDINMGCPVPKIVKNGCCSALINTPSLAKELYQAAVEGASGLPVSIKTRLGFRKIQTEEWIGFLLELQPPALTIHGRYSKQMSNGPANWEEISRSVALRNIISPDTIILGNGDVMSHQEALSKHQEYKVDGVMVGRGIFSNLFLFDPNALPLREREPQEKLRLLREHTKLFLETWGSSRDFKVMKKFFKIYASDFRGATALRIKLMTSETWDEIEQVWKSSIEMA